MRTFEPRGMARANSVILEKIRIRSEVGLRRDALEISEFHDQVTDELIVRLTATLSAGHWTEYTGENRTERVPKTWWDAFRLRFFPNVFPQSIKFHKIAVRQQEIHHYWVFPKVPPNPNPGVEKFVINYLSKE